MKHYLMITLVFFTAALTFVGAADLTTSEVTVLRKEALANKSGKYVGTAVVCRATLATNGTWTSNNRIPASAFGLAKVVSVSNFTGIENSTNSVVAASVQEDMLGVVLKKSSDNTLADYSGTYRFTVFGY